MAYVLSFFVTGIAVTLFAESIGTILRKRGATGKLNLPLAIPSVLIFMFATVVSLMLLNAKLFLRFFFQNTIGLWLNTYRTFVVNGADPMAYLNLIRSPAKTVFQTGQIGAIVLADALVVGLFSLHTSVMNLRNLHV